MTKDEEMKMKATLDDFLVKVQQLRSDCITMALRLYGEDQNTFSPETATVMDRWRPICRSIFGSSLHEAEAALDMVEETNNLLAHVAKGQRA